MGAAPAARIGAAATGGKFGLFAGASETADSLLDDKARSSELGHLTAVGGGVSSTSAGLSVCIVACALCLRGLIAL